jgi:hypothetical protein
MKFPALKSFDHRTAENVVKALMYGFSPNDQVVVGSTRVAIGSSMPKSHIARNNGMADCPQIIGGLPLMEGRQ